MPRILSALAAVTLLALACSQEPEPTAPEPEAAPRTAAQVDDDAADTPSIAVGEQADHPDASRIAARHILVAHEGAARRPPHVQRDIAAARSRAEDLRERLEAGESFEELASDESDCSSADEGGFLGAFGQGAMHPDFETAAFALPVGDVSGVVETPFGFHLILREPLEEAHILQIVLQTRAKPGRPAPHTPEEAWALGTTARERLDAGEHFELVARELSDGPTGIRGGDLGVITRGRYLEDWEQRAFGLAPGETTGPFETELGVHVLRRLE